MRLLSLQGENHRRGGQTMASNHATEFLPKGSKIFTTFPEVFFIPEFVSSLLFCRLRESPPVSSDLGDGLGGRWMNGSFSPSYTCRLLSWVSFSSISFSRGRFCIWSWRHEVSVVNGQWDDGGRSWLGFLLVNEPVDSSNGPSWQAS